MEDEIRKIEKNAKWGSLREDKEDADKGGVDKVTGLFRTSLYEYLKVIFPTKDDWIHDKTIFDCSRKLSPDYRSESLKLIIEFDGYTHYKEPEKIKKMSKNKIL